MIAKKPNRRWAFWFFEGDRLLNQCEYCASQHAHVTVIGMLGTGFQARSLSCLFAGGGSGFGGVYRILYRFNSSLFSPCCDIGILIDVVVKILTVEVME